MGINLLEITAEELLEKFGAGKHKPGSGSAAAFQGMLTAKLLNTVITLTTSPERQQRYGKVQSELLEMDKEIQERVFPKLTSLFQEDAIQFDKTIKTRIKRDRETDIVKSNLLGKKALEELKQAIRIPIEIAELCIELSEMASFVFDNGFKSARGDSQVALSGAVAGVAGCLAIIQLNLLSFRSDDILWILEITKQTIDLKKKYIHLNKSAEQKIEILEIEVSKKAKLYDEVHSFLMNIRSKPNLTYKEIEALTSDFQNILWKHKEQIWSNNWPNHPVRVLQPDIALKKVLAYSYEKVEKLDFDDSINGNFEIAGIIDQKDKIVLVSQKFDKTTQNFTTAHELGHALLHEQTFLHRDRPINGVPGDFHRDLTELQADKFATFFLMPKKLVKKEFVEMFGTEKFIINELTAFNLINDSPSKLRSECGNLRGISMKLASSERYNNRSFNSISELFNVSVTAMAIRLEELQLVEF